MSLQMFKGRKMVIATKHGKQAVLAAPFREELGIIPIVSKLFNTDAFGTFTGEIERKSDPLATAREKCRAAMDLTGCSLALASEGSFGPHPQVWMGSCNEELLLFKDLENDLEISYSALSVHTNFSGRKVKDQQELTRFAIAAKFPSHALILSKPDSRSFVKGIQSWEELYHYFKHLKEQTEEVFVQTDMRAMHNPTRMQFIGQVAQKLLHKIKTACPKCATPGFGMVGVRRGLPCNNCNEPTDSVIAHVLECLRCHYSEEILYPEGKRFEDPQYCNQCNP